RHLLVDLIQPPAAFLNLSLELLDLLLELRLPFEQRPFAAVHEAVGIVRGPLLRSFRSLLAHGFPSHHEPVSVTPKTGLVLPIKPPPFAVRTLRRRSVHLVTT